MRKYVIIVAGGKGERMGKNIPKQFLELNEQPILMHTIRKFHSTYPEAQIILALPENQFDFWEELCYKKEFTNIPHQIVAGGQTRFHSVQNALALVNEEGIVAIHDGVRPLVSKTTIVVDSLRYVNKTENKAVKRSCYKIVQTPQCFQTALIKEAYQQAFKEVFTDDASVVEALGTVIHLVEGNRENLKITSPEDLKIASLFFLVN